MGAIALSSLPASTAATGNLVPSSETDPGADHYRQSANQALTVFVGALKACKLRYNFTDLAILLQSGLACVFR
ncbi:hypothetical protein [Acidiferrobacter thiooxydans]|uniref:hypothetical protein n=1 Tax=Acidiferrobacter thiooxydans TaxID=163359 RepID=UPI0011C01A28|nr:hypothetical protein [Acidiferrobacter thiooxydans]